MGLTVRELCPDAEWFALTVRHQHEKQAEQLLRIKGWDTLLPLYRSRRIWSDRVQEVDLPLFAGYVFCRFAAREKARVLNTPGVAAVVGFGGAPAAIEANEIEEIRKIATSGLPLRPWPFLKLGDRVRVERGPLRGLEGIVLKDRDGSRLVVGMELLQRSIGVEFEPEAITLAAKATGEIR